MAKRRENWSKNTMLGFFTQSDVGILTRPGVCVYLLKVIPLPEVIHQGYDVFYSGEITVLCLGFEGFRVHREREVVANFGQRHQRYDLRTLKGDSPLEIVEIDVTKDRFVDPFKVRGEFSDEICGRLAPVRGGFGYSWVLGLRFLGMIGGRAAPTLLVSRCNQGTSSKCK
jgi:hypothetical protein